ncbi:hypothetical protein ILUMI_23113 [Ignelater luminosus]|uniref:Uncharacterized protein n=1 Tax=Ignelater luminosus TaxID=2038154 RepID=A0A8K0CD28_IGNLU|nr:hypothetical protein ILUMI_23113 [Ignelater luminosus]
MVLSLLNYFVSEKENGDPLLSLNAIHEGNVRHSWQDSSSRSVKQPIGYEGKCFIVVHAGGEYGFVEDASLLLASKTKLQNYHGEMNGNTFVLCEKYPNTSFNKNQIIDWLKEYNIEFEDGVTKAELLNIVKKNKKEKEYVMDEIIRSYGHEVAHTPPYQRKFNATELIWAHLKQYYDRHIGKEEHDNQAVLNMWNESLQQITTPDIWKNCVRHTNTIIKDWYKVFLEEVENLFE